MRVHNSTRYAAMAALLGGLACAGNKARTSDTTDQAAAARDTTTSRRDTVGAQTENPPGYRGMERDTSIAPAAQPTASDTFLQKQGQGTPQDTAGYSAMERVDTTGRAARTDTSGYRRDTTTANPGGLDSTGMSRTGDTTGYRPSQQARDSSAR